MLERFRGIVSRQCGVGEKHVRVMTAEDGIDGGRILQGSSSYPAAIKSICVRVVKPQCSEQGGWTAQRGFVGFGKGFSMRGCEQAI